MGTFKDRINYQPHNFNTFRVTLNGTDNVTGLNSFAVERNEDEVTPAIAADGVGLFQENPNISGIFELEIIEADATNAVLWDLWSAGTTFGVAAVDSNETRLNCAGAQCRVKKAPRREKQLEVSYVTWTIETIYLDLNGGGYSIVDAG